MNGLKEAAREVVQDLERYTRTHGPGPDRRFTEFLTALESADFALTIDTANDAFTNPAELPLILRKLAQDIERGTKEGRILDSNGNRCGSWEKGGTE